MNLNLNLKIKENTILKRMKKMRKILMKVMIELMIIMMNTLNQLIIRETRTEWMKSCFSSNCSFQGTRERTFTIKNKLKIVEFAKSHNNKNHLAAKKYSV